MLALRRTRGWHKRPWSAYQPMDIMRLDARDFFDRTEEFTASLVAEIAHTGKITSGLMFEREPDPVMNMTDPFERRIPEDIAKPSKAKAKRGRPRARESQQREFLKTTAIPFLLKRLAVMEE